jgi:hypothetical protein
MGIMEYIYVFKERRRVERSTKAILPNNSISKLELKATKSSNKSAVDTKKMLIKNTVTIR